MKYIIQYKTSAGVTRRAFITAQDKSAVKSHFKAWHESQGDELLLIGKTWKQQ